MGLSQGRAVDASSVLAGRAESQSGASAASDTDPRNDEDLPAVLSGRAVHELGNWGRLPATVRGRTQGQSQRLEGEPAEEQLRLDPEVTDALLAAVCTKSIASVSKKFGGCCNEHGLTFFFETSHKLLFARNSTPRYT